MKYGEKISREEFLSYLETVCQEVLVTNEDDTRLAEALQRFKTMLLYNLRGGKYNRGMSVADSFSILASTTLATHDNMQRAIRVGWAIEFMQSFFLIADDIMDKSLTRRGCPCWYKVEGVGLDAINDSFFVEQMVFVILRQQCQKESYYKDLVHLFQDTIFQTVVGQSLDLTTAPVGAKVDLNTYTQERYDTIVQYKTAYYSFYLPVAAALIMCGINDQDILQSTQKVLLELGRYFQIQDDFLDCFGDPAVTGKIGTDIEDNKCSWLVVQALQLVTPEQKITLESNYGKDDPSKVKVIKDLYTSLDLQKIYHQYEETSYKSVLQLIENLNVPYNKQVLTLFAEKIYKRTK